MPSKKHKFQPVGIGMTPSTTELGNFIRARRLGLNLRQTQLAELAGLSQNQLSMLEIGTRRYLNPKHLEGLAKALQCNPEELRKRMPTKRTIQPTTKLGQFIRSHREELGLTLPDLAKKLGVTSQQARCLEIRKNPTILYGRAKSLAQALNLDLSVFGEFLGRTQKPTSNKLGQLVRTRRKELAMSIIDLAKLIHTSQQFVSQIEFGQCPLSKAEELIERLAQALKLDPGKLRAVQPHRRLKQVRILPNSLGGFLAARRLELQLTQREVDERAGISCTTVLSIEKGKIRHPNPKLLDKLAEALECTIPPDLVPAPSSSSSSSVPSVRLSGRTLNYLVQIKEHTDARSITEVAEKAIQLLWQMTVEP